MHGRLAKIGASIVSFLGHVFYFFGLTLSLADCDFLSMFLVLLIRLFLRFHGISSLFYP